MRWRNIFGGLALAAGLFDAGPAQAAEIIQLRSGQVGGLPGSVAQFDDIVTWGAISGSLPLSNAPFAAADFNTAANWPAMVAEPFLYGWVYPLPADPLARWINFDVWFDPHPDFGYHRSSVGTTLYRVPFTVTTTSITSASLSVYWASDDRWGDLATEPNQIAAYLRDGAGNVTPLPLVTGGGLSSQSQAVNMNVTSAIGTGVNELFFYQRDTHGVTSGSIFSVRLEVNVPEPTTFGLLSLAAWGVVAAARRRGT